jgi:copper(I)-binding protein
MRWMRAAGLGLAAAAVLAGCRAPEPAVTDAWVRLNAVPGRPAAGYFRLDGGKTAETLLGAGSTAFKRIELHESTATGMRRLPSVPVPAGGQVRFAPAGLHLMLFDAEPSVKPGTTLPLQLTFADGGSLTVEARVVGAADPAP